MSTPALHPVVTSKPSTAPLTGPNLWATFSHSCWAAFASAVLGLLLGLVHKLAVALWPFPLRLGAVVGACTACRRGAITPVLSFCHHAVESSCDSGHERPTTTAALVVRYPDPTSYDGASCGKAAYGPAARALLCARLRAAALGLPSPRALVTQLQLPSQATAIRLVLNKSYGQEWRAAASVAAACQRQPRRTHPATARRSTSPSRVGAAAALLLPSTASPCVALVSVRYKIHGAEPEQLAPGWARRLVNLVLSGPGTDSQPQHHQHQLQYQHGWRWHGSQRQGTPPTSSSCTGAPGTEQLLVQLQGQAAAAGATAAAAGGAGCVRLAGVCVRRGCVELTMDMLVALPHPGISAKGMDGAAWTAEVFRAGAASAAGGAAAQASCPSSVAPPSSAAAATADWLDAVVPAVEAVVEALGLGDAVKQEDVAAAAAAATLASGGAGRGQQQQQQEKLGGAAASVVLPGTPVGGVELRVRVVGGGPLRQLQQPQSPAQQQPGAPLRLPQGGGVAPAATPRVVALQPRVLLLPPFSPCSPSGDHTSSAGAPEVLLHAVVARRRPQRLQESQQPPQPNEASQQALAPPSLLVRAHNQVLLTRVVHFVRCDGDGDVAGALSSASSAGDAGGGAGAPAAVAAESTAGATAAEASQTAASSGTGEELYRLCVAVAMPRRPGPVLAELEWEGGAAEVLPLMALRDDGDGSGNGGAATAAAAELGAMTAAVAELRTEAALISTPAPVEAATAAEAADADATATAAHQQASVLDSLLLDMAVWAQAEAEAAEAAAAEAAAATAVAAAAEAETLQQPALLPQRLPSAQLLYLGRHLLAFAQGVGLPATATWLAVGLERMSASLDDGYGAPDVADAAAAGSASEAMPRGDAEVPACASTAGVKAGTLHLGGVLGVLGEGAAAGRRTSDEAGSGLLGLWQYALKATVGLERSSHEDEARLQCFLAPWAVAQEHFIHVVEVVGFVGLIVRFAADGTLFHWGVLPFMIGAVPGIVSLCAWLLLPPAGWVRFVQDAKLVRYFFYLLVKTLVAAGLPVVTGQAQQYQGGLGVVMLEGVLMPMSCLLPFRTAAVVMAARVLPSTAAMLRTGVTSFPSEALASSLGVSAVAVITTLLCHAYLRVSFIRHQRCQQALGAGAGAASATGSLAAWKEVGGGEACAARSPVAATTAGVVDAHKPKAE